MALFRQQFLAPELYLPISKPALRTRCRTRAKYILPALLVVMGIASTRCRGQMAESEAGHSSANLFFTIGGESSQLRTLTDNALGFDSGFAYQPRKLLGFETRVGTYPYKAEFVQTPFTAGYRAAADTFFGFPYSPFVYIGGGMSRSEEESSRKAATSAVFSPCWQADIGLDRAYSRFSWRIAQASWRETYGPLQTLRSIGLSTGIVYRMQR